MTAFGLLLPTREIVMNQEVPDFRQILDLAEHAEEAGFDSVWVGDSVLARPRFEALTTLAAVAARTQRVRLGTAVLLPMLRQPVVLANQVANLDLVASGRLILGVGIGGNNASVAQEFAACGVPIARRIGMFEETLALMRRLWTEAEVTFEGRYFQLQSVRLGLRPLQQSGVPLWLAGSGDNALRRVLRLGDGWLPISSSPPSRRIGSAFKHWDERWGETPTTSIAVCIQRSTSTPMSPRRNASYACLSKTIIKFPMRCKRLGTASVQARRSSASPGSRRLLLLAHRRSWFASAVPIKWDNWRGLPGRFCRTCGQGSHAEMKRRFLCPMSQGSD
jgi:alkanesulfonate monooxygenase SsuD/methylene tetrahydromethanopterin reductase-like flavin-dependent oxidoreductase (luciferase family)